MRRRSVILSRLTVLAALLGAAVAIPSGATAGGGCHGDIGSEYSEGAATVVRMDVCDFAPTVTRVPLGTEVRFLNTDVVAHIVIGRRNTWASEELPPGAEFAQRFDAAGTYPYMCSFHPGMVGTVVVGGPAEAAASSAPSVVSAMTAADAGDGPAVGLIVGIGVVTLLAGVATGLLLARRRSPITSGTPGVALD
jgi:plastocyanin